MKSVDYTKETANDLIGRILGEAIDSRASDVHFQPERESFEIKFRIDGILYLTQTLEITSQDEVVSCVKVLSKLDIAEKRLPQDGHFEFQYKDHIYDVRVATSPTIYGEALVLRILNREETIFQIEDLGLEPDQLELVSKLITSPYGIVLITAPTASGKTTFLYSVLNRLHRPERNIITLEDPVEFQMAGIRQIKIEERLGLTFAKAMRSVLRQDPNIIMVGEIRDPETAQMAFQSALGGILVFSTFHTFDVPALVIRLIEMGVPRSVVSHALAGVVSTRLVRKICDACRVNYEMTDADKKLLGANAGGTLQKGTGCDACHKSGYLGRTGIFEVVTFDEEIRTTMLEEGNFAKSLRELLREKTIRNLRDVAVSKVTQGITTAEEVKRVIGDQWQSMII